MWKSPGTLGFSGPENIVIGRGTITSLGQRVEDLGSNLLVVTDEGIRSAGIVDTVTDRIPGDAVSVKIYDGVEPDPSARHVREALDQATAHDADVVIGLGGGSSMDVAKLTAGFFTQTKPLEELFGRHTLEHEALPTILIPTTAGTGSEVSSGAVVFGEDGHKLGVADDELFAHTALVDPDLSMHLPAQITKTTGLDAFTHAIGSYISTTTNRFANAVCVDAMLMIERHLRDASFHGADAPEAREHMSFAATMAMLGRVNGGKAAMHSFAYGLQDKYDLPHGQAIAMILPEVVELNLPGAVDALAELGEHIYDATGARRARAQVAIDGIYRLRNDLGMDYSLRSIGATEDDLDELSTMALHSDRHLKANPRELTSSDARTVFETIW